MHSTSHYVSTSYNWADFWTICKQKDLSICPQGHHIHERKKHVIWRSQCSHSVYCLNAGRSLVSTCATLRNPWENTDFLTVVNPFLSLFLILSLLLILVRTFGTDRVGEDDVLLEKWVLPCHISAPEGSNTNVQSNQRQTASDELQLKALWLLSNRITENSLPRIMTQFLIISLYECSALLCCLRQDATKREIN